MQYRVLFLGDIAVWVLQSCLGDPDTADHDMGPEIGRRAGNDTVVIARKALRFPQPLFAAARATVPIRMLGSISVIGGEEGSRLDGHFVDRSISKVNHPLR